MVRPSPGSAAAAAAALVLVLQASSSAHRRDEYLQAARVALLPDRVTIQLDLTPGIDVADAIVRLVDRDGDGTLSAGEQRRYADDVVGALDARVDEDRLALQLSGSSFPSIAAMRAGEGTIQLLASAAHRRLTGGAHQFFLENPHQPQRSVYLANALVPATSLLAVLDQRRDERQTQVTIDYRVRADAAVPYAAWVFAGLPIAAVLVWRRTRRHRPVSRVNPDPSAFITNISKSPSRLE